jgi:hypothetical protein
VAIAKKKVDKGKPTQKRTRRQGANKKGGASMIEIIDDRKYDVAVADVVSFLEQIESADAKDTFLRLNTVIINCEKCGRAGIDMPVPAVLLPLHYLIVHSEKDAEIPVRKET